MRILIPLLLAASIVQADDGCRRALSFVDLALSSDRSAIRSALYGDFNEDGRPDVVLQMNDNSRVIALNRGSVFESMPAESLGANPPVAVAVADVNGDGHLDLLYLQRVFGGDSLGVAYGRGDGTFQPPVMHTVLLPDYDVGGVVDFDRDRVPDHVRSSLLRTGSVTFVHGKRDGTYEAAPTFTFSTPVFPPIKIVAGDFDGDGNIDVVRFGTNSLAISDLVFGWNDGTFHFTEQAARGLKTPNTPLPLDIDGDGAEELVAIDDGALVIVRAKNRTVSVERIPVAPAGTSVTLKDAVMTDADGDGIRDLVFAGPPAGVLYGTADKRFRDAFFFDSLATGFTALDVDGDGLLDLASTGGSEGLSVVHGAALRAGKPDANRIYALGSTSARALADVDGDGVPDLIGTGNVGSVFDGGYTVNVFFGDGHGEFRRAAKPFLLPSPAYSANTSFAGDFDGDGHADLAMTWATFSSDAPQAPAIVFGSADGFGGTPLMLDPQEIFGSVVLDPSSPPALVSVKGNDVQLITISSGRTAAATTIYHLDPVNRSHIAVVRTPPSAPPQLLVVNLDGSATLLMRSADGSWHEGLRVRPERGEDVAVSGDLDGDGLPDLVIANSPSLAWYDSTKGFSEQHQFTAGAEYLASADVDGDGRLDLIAAANDNEGGLVQVLRNNGTGFEPYASARTTVVGHPIVADVDGDGWPDVLVPTSFGAELLRNVCAAPRIHADAVPFNPAEGTPVELVIHVVPSVVAFPGGITIREGNKVLATFSRATVKWISPPLTPGSHTYTIEYRDQYSGTFQTNITVTPRSAVRRRAAGR